MKRGLILIIVLGVLLVGILGYVGAGKYGETNEEGQLEIFEQGAQYGYEQAVIQIVQMAVTCEQVPLRIENQTINMIAVDCLNLGGQQ